MPSREEQYNSMLESAHNFLFRKAKPLKGSALNSAQHNYIVISGGKCLHCGVNLTLKNSNTEHIHDLALGGSNYVENKIIICRNCNEARNLTMQRYLGTPSYWRGFPGNWDRVKKYLIWNAITVDEGHYCGKEISDVHQIFESIISGRRTKRPPENWFGRGGITRITSNHRRYGFFIRFFDKLFGFRPTNIQIPQVENNTKVEEEVNENQIDDERGLGDEFYSPINDVISNLEEEVRLTQFSTFLKDYLEVNGKERLSLREFSRSFGIPKSWSCVKVLELYFSENIDFRREGSRIYIRPKGMLL